MEERLIELEVRVAFQERLIAELDEVVRTLRAQVDRLEGEIAQLVEHLHAGSDES